MWPWRSVDFCVAFQIKQFAGEDKDENKTVEKEERIVKDLQQMSQKEKMKLLKEESPELLELIQDFKAKVKWPQVMHESACVVRGIMWAQPVWSVQLTELKDELHPLVQMVKDGKIPPGKVNIFVHIPQSASDNTCNNNKNELTCCLSLKRGQTTSGLNNSSISSKLHSLCS